MLVKIVPSVVFSFDLKDESFLEYEGVASSVQVDESQSYNIYNPWATGKAAARGLLVSKVKNILKVLTENKYQKNEVLAFIEDDKISSVVNAKVTSDLENSIKRVLGVHPDFEICADGITLQIESSDNRNEIIGESTVLTKPKVLSDFVAVYTNVREVQADDTHIVYAEVHISAPLNSTFLSGEKSTFSRVQELVAATAEGKLSVGYVFNLPIDNPDTSKFLIPLLQAGGKLAINDSILVVSF